MPGLPMPGQMQDLGLGIDPDWRTPNTFAKNVFMPRTRVPYPFEFRRQMVDLVRAGRDPGDQDLGGAGR